MTNAGDSQPHAAIKTVTLCFSLSISLFVDRHVTSEHLPWAKSRSPEADETLLMTRLEEFAERFSRAATPPPPTAAGSAQQDTAADPSTTTVTAEETSKE